MLFWVVQSLALGVKGIGGLPSRLNGTSRIITTIEVSMQNICIRVSCAKPFSLSKPACIVHNAISIL
jgi:hypothetical protein